MVATQRSQPLVSTSPSVTIDTTNHSHRPAAKPSSPPPKQPEPVVAPQVQPSPIPPTPTFFETIVIDKSVRSCAQTLHCIARDSLLTLACSGQVVYARDANLIICGSLHSGAEVMADGDIIVFGQLDGRALAGASGHTAAKIVTNAFQAELVSISNVPD